MAEKNNNAPEVPNEIGVIREILMGAHMREYTATFEAIRSELAAHAAENNASFDALDKQFNERLNALEKKMDQRFTALEARLDKHVNEINDKISNTDKNQKQKLAQLFQLLSTQIDG